MGSSKTTTVQAPPAPQYSQSMRDILTAQIELAPQLFAVEQRYQPLYAQLQSQIQDQLAQSALDQASRYYPQVAEIESRYQDLQRGAEVESLQKRLPEFQRAMESITPGYGEAVAKMGQFAQQSGEAALGRPDVQQYLSKVEGPRSGQIIGGVADYTPGGQLQGIGRPEEAGYMRGVSGPALSSGLENINQGLVQQYVGAMPGMQAATQAAGQLAAQELQAGKSLTPEEERYAAQSARQAFAARGTALGNQAIASEILGRADVSNRRLQERIANAAAAQQQVQSVYAPALQQALMRQQEGARYGLEAQSQLFGQQKAREDLAQSIQQQRFAQGMSREDMLRDAQSQAFSQALSREELAGKTQQTAFAQAGQREQADLFRMQGEAGLQAQRGQMAAAAMSALQGAQAPAISAFYQNPLLLNQANQAMSMGLNSQQMMGPQFFNPESQTGMGSIYGAYNAQTQLMAANAQARAGASAGRSAMFGSIGGGLLMGAGIAL